jgi:hypothetical protein
MKRSVLALFILILSSNTFFPQSSIMFTAKIDGSQETPAVITTATGTGTFVLSNNGTKLTYNITVNGLSGPITGSHFHNAAVGVAGSVVKSITFNGNTASGTWTSTDASQPLTDLLLNELLKGRLYVNAHTSANPGGEIRGQVLLTSGVGFTANMNGSQETPAVTTNATGTGSVRLNVDGTVSYDVTVAGLTVTASHFHDAAVGVAGGVVKSISLTNNTSAGTWTSSDASQPLTDALLSELIKGNLYMNAHTAANPGGEIRGQVLINNGASFTSKIDGTQETPSVATTATGTGTFVLSNNGTKLTYNITVNGLSGSITGSHFHNAAAGTAGSVVKSITFNGNTASGTWTTTDASQPLTDFLLDELLKGRLYVNAHTSANPGGEIRGQVLLTSGVGFISNMSGSQEIPPVTTSATGTSSVRLNVDGTISYDVTVAGLTVTASHFHDAAAGIGGSVVKGISLTNNTSSGVWASLDVTQPLTDLLVGELIKGNLYMNAHTVTNPGGEIRGQVTNTTDIVTGIQDVNNNNSIPTEFVLNQNYPNPFNPSTKINYAILQSGNVSLKVYDILGREAAVLVDSYQNPGNYSISFNADQKALASGIYFYTLKSGTNTQTRKMVLMK